MKQEFRSSLPQRKKLKHQLRKMSRFRSSTKHGEIKKVIAEIQPHHPTTVQSSLLIQENQ
jgi:hypothetical protein